MSSNTPYIFESPDGGKTIYARKFGENNRTLYHVSELALEEMKSLKEDMLWENIRIAAETDESLQIALENVKILYYLKQQNG